MTNFPRPARTWPATVLAAALALSLLPTAGHAAQAVTAEQRFACTPDAIRLCPHTIPDVERTGACMKAQKANLTPRCRYFFDQPSR